MGLDELLELLRAELRRVDTAILTVQWLLARHHSNRRRHHKVPQRVGCTKLRTSRPKRSL